MIDDKVILDALIAKIKIRLPKFEVKYKNESLFQRFLGVLMFFNKGYMTRYTTTMFGNVYFVSKEWVEANPRQAWKILAHEYVHLLDGDEHPIKFPVQYALPQLIGLGALLTLGAFWSLWFLPALLFLGALAPWGSKGRTESEMRGYSMSMAVNYWRYGDITSGQRAHIASSFTGPNYYYMCRDEAYIEMEIRTRELKILKGEAARATHPRAVEDVLAVLHSLGVLHADARTGENALA
jgi:hypothetical protein